MEQKLAEAPARLRRAELVLSQRSGEVLLVLDQVCDIHNLQAVMRTAEALGVQNVWIVKPAYVKGLKADEHVVQDKEVPQHIPPQAEVTGLLHRFLRDQGKGMPSYTMENLAPKGCGDLWRATATLEDGRTVVGRPDISKKLATRYASLEAMRLVNPDFKEVAPPKMVQTKKERLGTAKEAMLKSTQISKGADRWLTTREFESPSECLDALRDEGWEVWATALASTALELRKDLPEDTVPRRTAIVIGAEAAGVSQTLLQGADRLVYLPMYGFTESLNLSVATGLILQRLFDIRNSRGTLAPDDKATVRGLWWDQLASNATARARFEEYAEAFRQDAIAPVHDVRVASSPSPSPSPSPPPKGRRGWQRRHAAAAVSEAVPPANTVFSFCLGAAVGAIAVRILTPATRQQ